MLLKDYLKIEDMTLATFAGLIGVSKSFIYQLSCGKKECSKHTAVRIEQATGGKVSRSEMIWPEAYTEKTPRGEQQMRFATKIEEDT